MDDTVPGDGAPAGTGSGEGTSEARAAAQALAALHAVATLTALAWVLMADLPASHRTAALALLVAGAPLGPAALAARASLRALALVVAAGTVVIAGLTAVTGAAESPLALLFVWAAAWSFAFLPLRAALAELALIVSGYGIATLGGEEFAAGAGLPDWLLRTITVLAVAGFIGALAQTAGRRRRQLEAVFSGALDAVTIVDDDRRYVAVNEAAGALLGRRPSELVGMRIDDTLPPGREVEELWQIFLRRGEARYERDVVRRGGETRRVEVVARARIEPCRHLEVLRDVTAVRRAERRLAQRGAQQAAVAELGLIAVSGHDVGALAREAVALAARTLEVSHACFLEFLPDRAELRVGAVRGWRGEVLRGGQHLPAADGSPEARALDGEPVLFSARSVRGGAADRMRLAGVECGAAVPVRGRARPLGVLAVGHAGDRDFSGDDVTFLTALANLLSGAFERHAVEEAMRHRSLHDPLTDLPNRRLFLDRLRHALTAAERRGTAVAVLFLDLDNFKLVNDTLGHEAGDDLLRALAPRLRGELRASDTIARFGGDEFAILCEDVADEQHATEIAERLLAALREAVRFDGRDAHVSASIGIAVDRTGQADPEDLLRDADAALYRAKELGRHRWEVFDASLRRRAIARVRMETELRRALDDERLGIALEPVVALEHGTVIGAEALARWTHAEWGPVHPARFVGVAEASGLIVPLGRLVLRRACREAASAPESPAWVSVNVAARQLADASIVADVSAALEESGLDPRRLRLEITESTLLEGSDPPERTLQRLREMGVGVVLDDFGRGYSSLAYLRELPIDALKIDRAFLGDLSEGSADASIVAAIVALGRALGMEVIAEGVELPEQIGQLLALGCELAQGHVFPAAGAWDELPARGGEPVIPAPPRPAAPAR